MRIELSKDECQTFVRWLRQDIKNSKEILDCLKSEPSATTVQVTATDMAIRHAEAEITASLRVIQKLKGFGDNNEPQVLEVCSSGFGYGTWLRLNRDGYTGRILLPCGTMFAICDPPIVATKEHARIIDEVEVGDWICGVRRAEQCDSQVNID